MSTSWYTALTLQERAQLLKRKQFTENTIADETLGQQRWQRWSEQEPFTDNSYFEQRLNQLGLDETAFKQLLSTKIVSEAENPFLAQVLPDDPLPQPQWLQDDRYHFLSIFWPLIAKEIRSLQTKLQQLVQSHSYCPIQVKTFTDLAVENLLPSLLGLVHRTFILELNVARLQGTLVGETSEARFFHFIERLRQPEVLAPLLDEYPVMVRHIMLKLGQWHEYSYEFAQHLVQDWDEICHTFGLDVAEQLTRLRYGAGDTHRNGRSVILMGFASGTQLVYKPRSLGIDQAFQELLTWLNQQGSHAPFQTINVMAKDGYGWSEFVRPQPCTSPEDVTHFYEQLGGYLALLYVLAATDFHEENLIAAGKYPVLIDLETLFQPYLSAKQGQTALELAWRKINGSVFRTNMLPQRVWGSDGKKGIDFSGIGRAEAQTWPNLVPYMAQANTDEMKIALIEQAKEQAQNRPQLEDAPIQASDYTDAMIKGFTAIYQLLRQHSQALLATDGPLAAFNNAEIRLVVRPTRVYGQLLNNSHHPDFLRDGLDRSRLFDHLWLDVPEQAYLAQLIESEQEQLQQGDVPFFTTYPHSCDVWSGNGEHFPDLLVESGMALVRQRLAQLSDDDLRQQSWFIKASLTTLSTASDLKMVSNGSMDPQRTTETQAMIQARLLDTAVSIANQLENLAIKGENDATWIGLSLADEFDWTLAPLSIDLYDDLSGVILFLAYLGEVSGQEKFTKLAQAACQTLLTQIEQFQSIMFSVGGFEGWGGVLYALTHLAHLWQEPMYLDKAHELAQTLLPSLIAEDTSFDVVAGVAGCLASLLAFYESTGSPAIRPLLELAGQHLVDTAQPQAAGVAWYNANNGDQPLTGFSHGTAGIAWSLIKASQITQNRRFFETGMAALAYERCVVSPAVGNWPDLRFSAEDGRPGFMWAWCHGAPGIGLSRLDILPYLEEKEQEKAKEEIQMALASTVGQGFEGNHSLCHGALGNLLFVWQASQVLSDVPLQAEVYQIANGISEQIRVQGGLSGIVRHVESPGLMTGLSGIGYGLLQLAAPTQVPSILLMESPKMS